MKPSEGMRIGLRMLVATRGDYIDPPRGHERKYHGCALGSMIAGAVGDPAVAYRHYLLKETYNYVEELYGAEIIRQYVENPVTHQKRELIYVIESLFENDDWSRERIAKWLESLGL